MTGPTEIQRRQLDQAHAMVVSTLRQLDQIRAAVTQVLGPNDRAATAAEQSYERLQVTREMVEQRLGVAPVSFDLEHVTYDVVHRQDGLYVVLCDNDQVGEFTVTGNGDVTRQHLHAWALGALAAGTPIEFSTSPEQEQE